MHDNLGNHPCQEEPKKAKCKLPIGPIMPILHNLQSIALEVHLSVEIHFMKGLHRDFSPAIIYRSIFLVMEMEIVFNRSAWIAGFFIFSWGYGGSDVPVGTKYGDTGE